MFVHIVDDIFVYEPMKFPVKCRAPFLGVTLFGIPPRVILRLANGIVEGGQNVSWIINTNHCLVFGWGDNALETFHYPRWYYHYRKTNFGTFSLSFDMRKFLEFKSWPSHVQCVCRAIWLVLYRDTDILWSNYERDKILHNLLMFQNLTMAFSSEKGP